MAVFSRYEDSDSKNVSWRRSKGPDGRWHFRREKRDGTLIVYLTLLGDKYPAMKTLRGEAAELMWAVVEMGGATPDSDFGIRTHMRPLILSWKPSKLRNRFWRAVRKPWEKPSVEEHLLQQVANTEADAHDT